MFSVLSLFLIGSRHQSYRFLTRLIQREKERGKEGEEKKEVEKGLFSIERDRVLVQIENRAHGGFSESFLRLISE